MFDFFRKSDRSDNLRLSGASTISKSSFRANVIFPDEGNGNGGATTSLLDPQIHAISEEDILLPNGSSNNNNGESLLYPTQKKSLAAPQTQRKRRPSNTNLMPKNQGIAQQRNLIDELEHYQQTAALEGVTNQLHSMTVQEQERAMYDLHAATPKVTMEREASQPEEKWMEQMDAAIAALSTPHHPALQLAMHTNLQYVKDQRWKFLRSEDWNVERAVDRMSRFFELKLETFGSERLCRELRLDDLPARDVQWWKETGFLQVLDEKDASGRPVVFFFGKAQMAVPVETVIRVSLYLTCLSANEPRLQQTGIVQGYWAHGQPFLADPHRATVILQAWRCMPLRNAAKHFCYDNEKLKPLFSLMAREWNPFQTIRFRTHFGSAMECIYNLMTFGISRESMPVREDGSVTLEYHQSFLEALEIREKAERLLMALSESNGYLNEPFLSVDDQEDLMQQMLEEDEYDFQDDPLPLDASIQDFLPDDVLQRLMHSSTCTSNHEPLPIDTNLSDLESMPKSFLSRLARSSFLRSGGGGPSSSTEPKNNGMRSPFPATAPAENRTNPMGEIGITKLIVVPGPLDVIMGRGRHNKSKPGNRKLQAKLEEYYEEYENADKYQKTALAESILTAMKEEGSRFLIRQGEKKHGVWVQVSHEKARDKIAHDFRNMRGNTATNKKDDGAINREKRPRSITSSTKQGFFKRPFGL